MTLPRAHAWLSELSPQLFCQTIPPTFTDAELAEFIVCVEALVSAQRSPFAWVVMADAMLSTSATQRKMFADGEARMQAQDKRFCAGTAIVLSSSVIRGVVTAIYWLTPPVYPYTLCSTRGEALAWARKMLDARNNPRVSSP